MQTHNFNFDGGEILTQIGATWFVSYSWYIYVDHEHKNWQNISTYKYRISRFDHSREHHTYWLRQIANMSPLKLKTNKIGLTGEETLHMANELLNLKGKN